MLQVWSDQKVLQTDYLDSLWMQIQKFSASNWLEKHILRIYVSFNNSLKDAIQHDLPWFVSINYLTTINYSSF